MPGDFGIQPCLPLWGVYGNTVLANLWRFWPGLWQVTGRPSTRNASRKGCGWPADFVGAALLPSGSSVAEPGTERPGRAPIQHPTDPTSSPHRSGQQCDPADTL